VKCAAASIVDRFISRDVEAIGALGDGEGRMRDCASRRISVIPLLE
jgi:hypothetical protein